MRLLFVHADRFAFEATAAAGDGRAGSEDAPMEGRMEDCIAAFVTVERADAADPEAVVASAAAELRDATDRLNTRKVSLYPSVHLSDDPASPDAAGTVLRDLETALAADREVLRAPVGWHTAFEVSCKGHPFSTLSRHVLPGDGDDGEGDDRTPSEWRLAFPGGDTVTLSERNPADTLGDEDADRVSDDLRALIASEVEDGTDGRTAGESDSGTTGEPGSETTGETTDKGERPPHVDLVREQGLAGYEQPVDGDELAGESALRWYPRGKLIRDSLAAYAADRAVDRGAMPVETPSTEDRPGVGHLPVMRDADLASSDLPMRLYELSTAPGSSTSDDRQSESEGDLTAFTGRQESTMPVVTTATRNVERAKAEFAAQAELALRTGEDLGLTYVPVVRTTRAFYDDNEAWVESLVDDLATPTLLELLPESRGRWEIKVDLATVDGCDRPIETATVELDVESAERFDVTYDADEEARHPTILYSTPTGNLENALAALLETVAEREIPRLPTWLSPTQVRFVPVGETHVEHCDALTEDLQSAGIRVDIDDRNLPVGERLAAAESDWVPYYAVVGDRVTERDAETLKVTVRGQGVERELTTDELEAVVLADVGDAPTTKRSLPKRLSRRPDFANR